MPMSSSSGKSRDALCYSDIMTRGAHDHKVAIAYAAATHLDVVRLD
jgi:hypothetical protein